MAQTREAYWHFHCPDCGFDDVDFGYRVPAAEIHCIVCLEENGRVTRLRRWLTVDNGIEAAAPSSAAAESLLA